MYSLNFCAVIVFVVELTRVFCNLMTNYITFNSKNTLLKLQKMKTLGLKTKLTNISTVDLPMQTQYFL